MRQKLLEATRGYFKDDESAEAAIDIIMGMLADNHYVPAVSHIGKAVAMAREMGKECIVVIGAGPDNPTVSSKVEDISLTNAEPFVYRRLHFEEPFIPPHDKHTHKRKGSREI